MTVICDRVGIKAFEAQENAMGTYIYKDLGILGIG